MPSFVLPCVLPIIGAVVALGTVYLTARAQHRDELRQRVRLVEQSRNQFDVELNDWDVRDLLGQGSSTTLYLPDGRALMLDTAANSIVRTDDWEPAYA